MRTSRKKQASRLRAQSIIFALAATLAMLTGMASAVFAQPDSPSTERWLSGGASIARGLSIEFGAVVLPETIGCDTLRSGSGDPWRFEVLAEFPLSPLIHPQLRLGVLRESGELRAHSAFPPVFPGPEGEPRPGAFDQVLLYNRTRLLATVGLRLAAARRLSFIAGLDLSSEISTTQTAQQEAIAPEEFLFSNRSRILPLRSGEIIAAAPVVLGLTLGAGYELPIGTRSVLSPQILLGAPITSHASGMPWRSFAFTAGLAVRFPLLSLDEPPPVVVVDSPEVIPSPRLEASVLTSPSIVSVKIDEFDSTEALPLLNQVFFSETSSTLPARYEELDAPGARAFTTAALTGSALDVYYHLLNIIGSRMVRATDATLTIAGYRNGRERGTNVARQRAETLRTYLNQVWGISSRRLKITAGALPKSPAIENSEEGFEENARAEVVPSDPNITAPIIRRHIQRVATPPSVVFYPRGVAEAGLASWSLDVMQDEQPWRSFRGTDELPDSIHWDWRSDSSSLPSIPMQLSYRLTIVDARGEAVSTPSRKIDVRYESLQKKLENRQNDTVIESYSLLLFNYDSPTVSPEDELLLRAIASAVRKGALVRITGYTDSLGLETHNRELANKRAAETARLFRALAPPGITIVVSDQGGERERFPYSTPEGRSHCRTVVIEVRTPAIEDL